MTTLFDAYHHLKKLMDEHGGNSPCYYNVWSVADIQDHGRQEYEEYKQDYKRNPDDYDGPPDKEFTPFTGNQLKHIADYMMEHSNAFIKDWIAFNEARSTMPDE